MTYRGPYGTWENVIVQASVKITFKNFQISIQHSTQKVVLLSGIRCKVSSEEWTNVNESQSFWNNLPTDSCQFNRYDVLFEGTAYKIAPQPGQESALTVYTISSYRVTFALTKTLETNLCGYKIIHMEQNCSSKLFHPKLFILEASKGKTFKTITKINVNNLDIFSYVNSKFVYVKKHVRLTRLYRDAEIRSRETNTGECTITGQHRPRQDSIPYENTGIYRSHSWRSDLHN